MAEIIDRSQNFPGFLQHTPIFVQAFHQAPKQFECSALDSGLRWYPLAEDEECMGKHVQICGWKKKIRLNLCDLMS